jgi:hypothetical protein
MNPRELVDHVRSGPAELLLVKPLRFRPQTRWFDFNEVLRSLQSSETIRIAECGPHTDLEITEDEWVILVKTIGRIKHIEDMRLYCTPGSQNFYPFQVVADAINNARSLHKLGVGLDLEKLESFPRDPTGQAALTSALGEHATLQTFKWIDFCSRVEAVQIDPVLRALTASPNLPKVRIVSRCTNADAMKNLPVQLQSATDLHLILEKENWLAVADEIRRGRCNVQRLNLCLLPVTTSEATEAVKAVASAIRLDQTLEHLKLQMGENGFTDEAGVALAEALTVNKTLRKITLTANAFLPQAHTQATLGVQSYEAFTTMLRTNTTLNLELPPFETAGADERLRESRDQLHIEDRLNKAGRGKLLASSQTTKEEWVDALHELNSDNVDFPPALQVSCLYSLLRLSPAVVS